MSSSATVKRLWRYGLLTLGLSVALWLMQDQPNVSTRAVGFVAGMLFITFALSTKLIITVIAEAFETPKASTSFTTIYRVDEVELDGIKGKSYFADLDAANARASLFSPDYACNAVVNPIKVQLDNEGVVRLLKKETNNG